MNVTCRRVGRGRRVLVALLLVLPLHAATTIAVDTDHVNGLYAAGEKAVFTIAVKTDGQPATGQVSYTCRLGGLRVRDRGKLDLVDGKASVTLGRDDPGTLLLSAVYEVPTGKKPAIDGGAVFDADHIQPSAPAPADFDAFWKAKLGELAAVPPNVKLEPVDCGDATIEYYKITFDNIRGTHIYGQLAKPKGKTRLPAILTVQWAGVYPLDRNWVLWDAKQGRLALNIMAHDLPCDQPKEFYAQQNNGPLKGYPTMGREDREQSYFLRMYLSCYRAADYLAHHADWDGTHLIVTGGSQGGGQSIVAAGLHPAITGIAAMVPAMCDHTGHLADRAPGWPRLLGWGEKPDSAKALAVSGYFDAVNFARRSQAKSSLVGVGLIDLTCPPAGCYAMFNQLPGEKQMVPMPKSGHQGPGQEVYYGAREKWLRKVLSTP